MEESQVVQLHNGLQSCGRVPGWELKTENLTCISEWSYPMWCVDLRFFSPSLKIRPLSGCWRGDIVRHKISLKLTFWKSVIICPDVMATGCVCDKQAWSKGALWEPNLIDDHCNFLPCRQQGLSNVPSPQQSGITK